LFGIAREELVGGTSLDDHAGHVVSSLDLASGGPTQSVTQLCEGLNALGAPAEIATVLAPHEQLPERRSTPFHTFPISAPRRLRRSPELARFLMDEAPRFDLIHVHGLWEWPGRYARQAARNHGKPLVVSPRGMLEPWSLRQSPWLKRWALVLWERATLRQAALLHATAQAEAEQFAALGFHNPVAVVPNGLALPPPPAAPRNTNHRALFLARLHPKKGADLLLRAWARSGAPLKGWRLDLAGPDEGGFRAHLERETGRLGLSDSVHFHGPVYGDEKWDLIRNADLFILPSHSENFGNAVAEALSQGVPVITTQGTPWQELQTRGCGWWIPLTEEALAGALAQAFSCEPSILAEMGHRASAWAQSTFTSEAAATALLRHYRSLLST
jgi:glycosyltransferase involved in cell wall biosynthesis